MLCNCSLAKKFIQISQTFSLRFVLFLNRITHNTIMYSYFKDFLKYGLRFSLLLNVNCYRAKKKKLKLERLTISEAEICITKSNTDY